MDQEHINSLQFLNYFLILKIKNQLNLYGYKKQAIKTIQLIKTMYYLFILQDKIGK
ncbi:unnamed protein product [Paramecium primaurelia]|uniref:Uncharacterized protein n=1 Tax=Paramecium primaurelia TaxID=5886 RepID=A0A8S1N7G1_PARPR|nr:unnamed protein product [Paramecium primaurelia]